MAGTKRKRDWSKIKRSAPHLVSVRMKPSTFTKMKELEKDIGRTGSAVMNHLLRDCLEGRLEYLPGSATAEILSQEWMWPLSEERATQRRDA